MRKGSLSQRGLLGSYRRNRRRILEHGREADWIDDIVTILGRDRGLDEGILEREIKEDEDGTSSLMDTLSSGQAILCHLVTGLHAWIEPDSIILFDEPETHLHPSAVAALFVILTGILRRYESHAVLATHSPVVLQEVPSRNVILFQREDGTTTAEPLSIEIFGESVTELTRQVFNTLEVENPYKDVLDRISRQMPPEEAMSLFPNGLGLAAQFYLLGRYAADGKL